MNVPGSYRKTPAQLALSGEMDRHPGRYANRSNCPEPTGPLGNPPNHLTDTQAAIWVELTSKVPKGALGDSDEYLIELAVTLLDKLRSGTAKAAEQSLLLSCLQQCGMTPIARQRIIVPKAPEENEVNWAELLHPVRSHPDTRQQPDQPNTGQNQTT